MNTNFKAQNNTAPQLNVGSFIAAPFNNAKNVATNVATSFKNVFNNYAPNNITEPLSNVVNETLKNTPSPFVSIPVILTLGILIVVFILVVIFRQQIVIGLDNIWSKLKELFGAEKTAVQSPPPEFVPESQFFDQGVIEKVLPGKKEVFNVSQNKYIYSDAEPLCKAFGAELATYDQVKDAWQKGADWCNYGWIKGQAAVYPTQQSTFDKMQTGPDDQKMACGVPGLNGGYFDNPDMRFGVNCYGVKPSENDADARAIMSQNGDLTPEALKYDRKVLKYKSEMGEIPVNPFKPGTWSD